MPTPPPPAPVTAAAPQFVAVKVDHPDPYKGKIGSEAKQWLTCMLAWIWLNQRMFPTQVEVLAFLLMNMDNTASAWAHPHLDLLGSHCAIIQTTDDFKREFLLAFGDPDTTRAAEQKITLLTQSGTCANYITKFCTLAMELDWNNAALHSQFAQGLHWEGGKYQPAGLDQQKLSNDPNFVSEEEQNRHCTKGACIKCSKMGHKFAECRTGWKATPREDKGKPKETAKIGKESGLDLGKD
ncbi:hypothetical protein RhiTH_009779 [Rhizoctonia solani]